MRDDSKPIDWAAERDAMRAPAYFAKVAQTNGTLAVDRGMPVEERAQKVETGIMRHARGHKG
jgi:hypothetical protein